MRPAAATTTNTNPPGLTIDQLSAASGVPSRTIRLYQTKGVLPRPARRGRVCEYGPEHLERLQLIAELQDRGLQLTAIRDLVDRGDAEGVLREWLGLGDRLRQPWSEDVPRVVSAAEVTTLVGDGVPGRLAALLRTGMLQPQSDGVSYLAPSPGLLDAALALDEAGVDLDTSAAAAAILRRRLAQAVTEVMRLLVERAGDGFGRDGSPAALTEAFEGIRVNGGDATRLIYASEVARAVNQLVAGGALTSVGQRERQS